MNILKLPTLLLFTLLFTTIYDSKTIVDTHNNYYKFYKYNVYHFCEHNNVIFTRTFRQAHLPLWLLIYDFRGYGLCGNHRQRRLFLLRARRLS